MITKEDTFALIEKAQSGDAGAEETLVRENMGLVVSAARHITVTGFETEDLIQAGSIGLLKAVRNFDTKMGVAFSTYAVPVITGEIKRYVRDNGPIKVSRRLKEIYLRVFRAQNILKKTLDREPTISEISNYCGDSEEDIITALDSSAAPLSFDASSDEDEKSTLADFVGEDRNDEITELLSLKTGIGLLSPEDRKLVVLRFFTGKTQCETAAMLDMTQVQVSRREKKILSFLREQIE